MTLQGYISTFGDNDLVDTNIKDGVEIFGVEGTYEGEIPVSSVAGYLIDETPRTMSNGSSYITNFDCYANFESNGYIFAIGFQYGIVLWKRQISTKQITYIGENGNTYPFYGNDSVYKDGDYIYFNYINGTPYNYKYNYITNIRYNSSVAGHHTTGTLLSGYATVGGLKYTGFNILKNGSGNINSNQHNFGFKIYS